MAAFNYFAGPSLTFDASGEAVSIEPASGLLTIRSDRLPDGATLTLAAHESSGGAASRFTLTIAAAEVEPSDSRLVGLASVPRVVVDGAPAGTILAEIKYVFREQGPLELEMASNLPMAGLKVGDPLGTIEAGSMDSELTLIDDSDGELVLEGNVIRFAKPATEGIKRPVVRAEMLGRKAEFAFFCTVVAALAILAPTSGAFAQNAEAGTTILELPPLVEGEVRTITPDDGRLAVGVAGDVVRGTTATSPGTISATVWQNRTQFVEQMDTTVSVNVEAGPFELTDFPEILVNMYLQGSVPEGALASVAAGGFVPQDASQSDPLLQPTKLADNGGVKFAENSGQHLEFSRVPDALASYRWALAIFRVDGSTGSGKTARLFTVNAVSGSGNVTGTQTPALEYRKDTGLLVARFRGLGSSGSTYYKLTSEAAVADGATWNVALIYRRGGRLFMGVNGVDAGASSPETLTFSVQPPPENSVSYIGDGDKTNPAWAYDTIVFGQTELSEALVKKIEGWAMWRVGRAADLPDDHPYQSAAPIASPEDIPSRYTFDQEAWGALWARWPTEKLWAKQGATFYADPAVTPAGYTRVFYDDFRVDSVGRSDRSFGGEDLIWYGPGWNDGVGKLAQAWEPNKAPDLYEHNATDQTLTLSLQNVAGTWRAATIHSVDEAGTGRSWEGGGIFRARVKFPDIQGNPDVDYFPAFLWFYNLEHLFWRTGERIEFDGYEFEGIDDDWINGGSSHIHAGEYPGLFGHLAADIPHEKIYGGNFAGFDVWDGQFHLYEVRIELDLTYLIIDGVEIARVETPKEYLERLYMIADYSLKDKGRIADKAVRHDMTIDYIEVLQRTDQGTGFAAPFVARPLITGGAQVGQTLTCTPNLLADVTDIRFYWYSDGYPRGFGLSQNYTVRPDDVGTAIRCMVRAVGAIDQPEAWTDETPKVTGLAPTISIASGSGYAGSVLTSTQAGQWTADGAPIAGEIGETFVLAHEYEGAAIQCAGSTPIEMWVPTDEPSVSYWWDGMDERVRTYSEATAISALIDKISGVAGTQTLASKQPKGDNAKILFDGNPDNLVLPNVPSSLRWMIFVGSVDWEAIGPRDGVLVGVNGFSGANGARTPAVTYRGSDDALSVRWQANGQQNPVHFSGLAQDEKVVLSSRLVGGVHRASLNGGAEQATGEGITPSGSNNTGQIGDNRTQRTVWQLGDLLLGSGELSDDALWKLQGWAAWRHGRESALSATHPYKAQAPRVEH